MRRRCDSAAETDRGVRVCTYNPESNGDARWIWTDFLIASKFGSARAAFSQEQLAIVHAADRPIRRVHILMRRILWSLARRGESDRGWWLNRAIEAF